MRVGYNDVDLCLKLTEAGYYNIVNNECVMTHHESLARGLDGESDDKSERLGTERGLLYQLQPWLGSHTDPFYGCGLDVDTIEIRYGATPEYQITDYRNKTRLFSKLPARHSDKIKMSIDLCSIERGIAEGAGDAYVIEGWGLSLSWDNALTEKFVVLIPLDEDDKEKREYIVTATSPKYRTDVSDVFPDASNALLAGFVCRMRSDRIDPHCRYRIGVLVRKKTGFKSCRAALGDIYEPRRGIVKDE